MLWFRGLLLEIEVEADLRVVMQLESQLGDGPEGVGKSTGLELCTVRGYQEHHIRDASKFAGRGRPPLLLLMMRGITRSSCMQPAAGVELCKPGNGCCSMDVVEMGIMAHAGAVQLLYGLRCLKQNGDVFGGAHAIIHIVILHSVLPVNVPVLMSLLLLLLLLL